MTAQGPVRDFLPPRRELGALEGAGDLSAKMQQMQREKWAVVIFSSRWRKDAPRNEP